MQPPPSPVRANFTLMIVCTTESSGYYSVYSMEETEQTFETLPLWGLIQYIMRAGGIPADLTTEYTG